MLLILAPGSFVFGQRVDSAGWIWRRRGQRADLSLVCVPGYGFLPVMSHLRSVCPGQSAVRPDDGAGQPYNNNWLGHEDLLRGGRIHFTMSERPDHQRGTGMTSPPYSLSNEK